MSASKGWTAERRAAQAAAVRARKPWERSTGPRTDAGKARSSRNAEGGGYRQWVAAELREVEGWLREFEVVLRDQRDGVLHPASILTS